MLTRESAGGTTGVPSPSNSDVSRDQCLGGTSMENTGCNSDTFAQLSSITVTLQTVQEAVKKIETNLVSVEQQQVKINESVKELTKLLKNQERENFPSKAPLGRLN